MKRLFLALAAFALIIPAAVSAQNTVVKTHFAGERITGVSASSAFEVVLVKSNQTKAVVEVNRDFESYIDISHDGDGIVTVGLRDMGSRGWRGFNRLSDRDRVLRLTLYLPSVNTIRLSGASELASSDSFAGENVDILLSGASEVDRLDISAARVKLQASGASEVSLMLPATRDLVVVASGASEIDIVARRLAYSKLGASGASEVNIHGDGGRGDWTVSGASEIDAEEFVAEELTVTASGASSARVNVTGTLTTKASGSSSVRYAGSPRIIDNSNNSVRPL